MLTAIDQVGVADNAAAFPLPEDFRQQHRRHRLTAQDGGEHISGPHRGKLCRVSHQHQAGGRRQRFQHRVHQADIHHGALVDNQRVAVQRILFVFREDQIQIIFRELCAKHAMDRGGFHPGELRHALCRAPGGCGQHRSEAKPVVELQHRTQGCGFPCPRAAGHGENAVLHRIAQDLLLLLGKTHALLRFTFLDQLLQIEFSFGQLLDHGGNPLRGLLLGPVHVGQIAGVLSGYRIADQVSLFRHVLHDGGDVLLLQLQLLSRRGAELRPGDEAVAVVFVVTQNKDHAGADPVRVCILDPQLFGQTVRRGKRRPDLVDGQQVGILLQKLQRVFAIEAIQPHRVFRRDSGGAQQKHKLLQADLTLELLCDLLRLIQADAADFGKQHGFLFQDAQRVSSEALDNLSRHDRTDSLDGAGSQIGEYRALVLRGAPLRGFRLELTPVGSVQAPVPVGRDGLSRPGIGEGPGQLLLGAVGVGHAQHGVAVFLVAVDNALDRTAEYVNLFLLIRFLVVDSIHGSLLTPNLYGFLFSRACGAVRPVFQKLTDSQS